MINFGDTKKDLEVQGKDPWKHATHKIGSYKPKQIEEQKA